MTKSPDSHSSARSILLVVGLLGLILTSIFLNRRTVQHIQEASASIYTDRLVPTGIIVNLTATAYRKRLLLETYVPATEKPHMSLLLGTLDRLNRRIDSLLIEFEKTRLTVKEADYLKLLKQRLVVYNQLEGEFTTNLTNLPKSRRILFAAGGSTSFGQVAQTLDELSSLQLSVGQELVNESRGETNYIYVLTALQIGLVLMIVMSLFWYRL